MFKDDAARTYKVLIGVGATAIEAQDSINAVIRSHARVYKRKLPTFTKDTLRGRDRRVALFDEVTTKEIVAKAVPNLATLDLANLKQEEREFSIFKPIARHILSGALDTILLSRWK